MNDVKLNGMRELNFNEIEEVSGGWWKQLSFAYSVFSLWRRNPTELGPGSDNPPRYIDATHINNNGSTFT